MNTLFWTLFQLLNLEHFSILNTFQFWTLWSLEHFFNLEHFWTFWTFFNLEHFWTFWTNLETRCWKGIFMFTPRAFLLLRWEQISKTVLSIDYFCSPLKPFILLRWEQISKTVLSIDFFCSPLKPLLPGEQIWNSVLFNGLFLFTPKTVPSLYI